MCGIFCSICHNGQNIETEQLHEALAKALGNRGPDAKQQLTEGNVFFAGFVLWQQGAQPQAQPLIENDHVLLFNGDLFNVSNEKPQALADSAWLAQQLSKCNSDEELVALLRQLEGPHCLVLFNKCTRQLYFARDALGRNSLVVEKHEKGINLVSTSHYLNEEQHSLELPPLGLYKMHGDNLNTCELFPWQAFNSRTTEQLEELQKTLNWRISVKDVIEPEWLLASLSAVPTYDFYELCATNGGNYEALLDVPAVRQCLDTLEDLLQRSVASRVQHTAPLCQKCVEISSCSHAKLCLLFSGGIDCSILALLADRIVAPEEPIELSNVAFERSTGDWDVPDRLTARQSLEELRRLCPKRHWKLLEVNVTRAELKEHLTGRIGQLIYPLRTVLDESIGCAFWFAAAAAESTARVALLGSGADELFGGYVRHRNAYRRCQGDEEARQEAVLRELEFDWERIPARNLARDDRVIADSGKTARAPFIEEHLVKFVRSLHPQQRCCFKLGEGIGDKLLLRLLGHRLGLRGAVVLKKRAIQFGSRIADKNQQAQQVSEYLRFGKEL